MLRYLGFALIVFMALGLAAGIAVVLLRSMPERQAMRLTVFDGVAAVGGDAPRLRAMFEDADTGKPILFTRLVVRFSHGWTDHTWSSSGGLSVSLGPTGLSAGPHDYTVGLSEMDLRLDVCSHGTVWVFPADTPVVWFDAAAICPMGEGAAATQLGEGGGMPTPLLRGHALDKGEIMPSERRAGHATRENQDSPLREVVDAVKTLAAGRQAVYLIDAEAAGYASVRQRLAGLRMPPGPAYWVRPGDEPARLQGLKQVWPGVEGAVVSAPAIAAAVERLRVRTSGVPRAGGPEPRAAVVGAWSDAVQRLSVVAAATATKEK